DASRRRARAELARLSGADAASRPLGPWPAPPSAEAAAGERDDVAAARLSAEAARASAQAARAARLPSLTATVRWEAHAPRPFASYGESLAVSAGVRVPLFTGGALSAAAAGASAEAR